MLSDTTFAASSIYNQSAQLPLNHAPRVKIFSFVLLYHPLGYLVLLLKTSISHPHMLPQPPLSSPLDLPPNALPFAPQFLPIL